jgi:hypothetical protein
MGLLDKTVPAFEADETSAGEVFASAPQTSESAAALAADTAAPAATETATSVVTPAADAPAAPAPAIVAARPAELAIPAPAYAISEGMKNSMRVDFNTFPQLTCTNGNFVERESKAILGDTIRFELLSFQDAWVVDPGDDKAPKELVRYSDDKITCSDGTPVAEHLEFLKAGGFPLASVKQRNVVVGEIINSSGKVRTYDGQLVQFDLSPMSRVQWSRYLANSVNAIRKGRKTEDELKIIDAVAELASKDDKVYTKATFTSVALAKTA